MMRTPSRLTARARYVAVAALAAHIANVGIGVGRGVLFVGASVWSLSRRPSVGGSLRRANPSPSHQPPPRLPAQDHRPKQSLGQNYLTDANYIAKIVDDFLDSLNAVRPLGPVVELGPGLGSITRPLFRQLPAMTVVEIDDRAVDILRRDMPQLDVVHLDLLKFDYAALSKKLGARLNIMGNLPYCITSDALLSLVRYPGAIRYAFVMVQKEARERILATPGSKDYGPLAAMIQLYARPRARFIVPATAFYPQPKVTSAMVSLDFLEPEELPRADPVQLKEVVLTSFQQRKKGLRHSLRVLLLRERMELPPTWSKRSAETMEPKDFVEVTNLIFPYR